MGGSEATGGQPTGGQATGGQATGGATAPVRWRVARPLVLALLGLKLLVTVWNAATFDGWGYDGRHHVWRAYIGCAADPMAYDPPLYYVPVFGTVTTTLTHDFDVPRKMTVEERNLPLQRLRWLNVVWLAVFYASWLFGVIPRLFADDRVRLLASGLLLALPGYQKMAVMPHPDNLHTAAAAACFAAWLWARERKARRLAAGGAAGDTGELALLAGLAIFAGWTRPFAAVTVAVTGIMAVAHARVGRRVFGAGFLARLVALTLVIGAGSSAWYVYRHAQTGLWGGAYNPRFIAKFAKGKQTFDWAHYFGSFEFAALVAHPNRGVGRDLPDPEARARIANSFFTTLYSEVWGDHWMHFSGKKRPYERPEKFDAKIWPKRMLFVTALPITLLLLLRLFVHLVRIVRRGPRDWARLPPDVALALLFVLGAGFYLFWQTGSGLTPGKNSSIKFIYSAYLAPAPLLLALHGRFGERRLWAWLFGAALLFAVALPVAFYWPAG